MRRIPVAAGGRASGLLLTGLAGALGSGCAYHVQLTSIPEAASVVLPDDRGVVTTPSVAAFRWSPFGDQVVTVRSPGYRVMTVDLRDHQIKLSRLLVGSLRPETWGDGVDGHVEFVLIPNHGPAGTWAPEDVP
jgi:hypothetical protein